MNINDETLSAFLDNELSPADMDAMRERIAEDESLANRLAELAAVDTLVREHYSAIDQQPIPAGIQQRIDDARPSAKILRFPTFSRPQLAMAASIAFAAAIGLGQWLGAPVDPGQAAWANIAEALDTTPSGQTRLLESGVAVTPRVSFTNAQGLPCRQYQTREGEVLNQAIACRGTHHWQQVANIRSEIAAGDGDYQTASSDSAINQLVERMAVGDFMNRAQESEAIANQWPVLPLPSSSAQ